MSSNINTETGEYISAEGRSPRFSSWLFLMVCSCVTLSASVQVKKDMQVPNEASKWAVGGTSVALIVSFFVSVAHLHPVASAVLVGSILEGLSALVMTIVWAATVSIITKTGNNLGVVKSDTNQVGNGNLYYGSWLGFVLSIVLFVSYLRSARGLDLVDTVKGRGQRLTLWAGYFAASIVVLGSSARVMEEDCTGESAANFSTEYCTRTKLGMALGAVGFVLSLFIIAIKLLASVSYTMVELCLASILTTMGAIGVGFITSNQGPGRAIGNLYYFSWLACIAAALIVVECFNGNKTDEVAPGGSKNRTTKQHEITVETMSPEEVAYT